MQIFHINNLNDLKKYNKRYKFDSGGFYCIYLGSTSKINFNIFEKVFDLVRDLVQNNQEKRKYMFIIDSMDGMCRQSDYDKAFGDAEQVAGGSLISSVFLKKQSLPISK